MKMRQDSGDFKNPDNDSEPDYELNELVEQIEDMPVVMVGLGDNDSESDEEIDLNDINDPPYDITDSDSDSIIYNMDDSDMPMLETDSDDEFPNLTNASKPLEEIVNSQANEDSGPSGSSGIQNAGEADSDNKLDDATIHAMMVAIKKQRKTPGDIILEDFITDICFHPERDIIALGTIVGDISLYQYRTEENIHLRDIEVHAKACRDIEFSEDGKNLLTCSKDKSIMITDMETGKLKKFYESAHDDAVNKLHVINENLFATGDDSGTVKLWDLRTKHEIFALKEVEDYISQLLTNDDKKLLLFTSGDGFLTTINIGARKLYVQSEPYEEELTCMGIYRGDSKLVVGSSKGRLFSYNWGQFGYHCDVFPGLKTPISEMIPLTDRIACVAGEEGIIHACNVAPFRILGVVGQHNMPIECLDINCSGELLASSSHNNDVRFWNMKYIEDIGDIKYNEKHNAHKEKKHNLPSSKFSNVKDFFADLNQPDDDDDSGGVASTSANSSK